jgi:hypothetical protein
MLSTWTIRRHSRSSLLAGLLLIALAASSQTGCLTRQIRSAVEESNAAVVAATLAGSEKTLDFEAAPSTKTGWEDANQRLTAFIADNPDKPRTINPLRIRQATMLLAYGETNRAKQVFREIDAGSLSSDRDLALYRIRSTLVWYYGTQTITGPADQKSARNGLKEIAVASDEARSVSTKRLLEQMRMRIATELARSLGDKVEAIALLEEATTRYGWSFSEAERQQVEAIANLSSTDSEDTGEIESFENFRWLAYAPTAFVNAQKAYAAHGGDGTLVPEWASPAPGSS